MKNFTNTQQRTQFLPREVTLTKARWSLADLGNKVTYSKSQLN